MQNPILRGLNPDPAICRAGEEYFIATSTFEWFPGVQIHQSHDLLEWSMVARPLAEARLLDLTGVPDSCGVWAPCLTFADGLFWLCYTTVRRFDGDFKDTPNFLTTAKSIEGPWSDPIFLNASGFDPSLFHDDDGRKWLLNMIWDHRPDRSHDPLRVGARRGANRAAPGQATLPPRSPAARSAAPAVGGVAITDSNRCIAVVPV